MEMANQVISTSKPRYGLAFFTLWENTPTFSCHAVLHFQVSMHETHKCECIVFWQSSYIKICTLISVWCDHACICAVVTLTFQS